MKRKRKKRNKNKHLFKRVEAAEQKKDMRQAFLFDRKPCATLGVLPWIFSGGTTCLYTYCISSKNSSVGEL